MPRVTALQAERRDRVRVELDGAPWRTLPAAAVVSAGLMLGVELDRGKARELGRALRRSEALGRAAAALARHDHSTAGLDAALARRGIPAAAREGALATMTRLGYLDDARFAAERAASLARRGYGDEAIVHDLRGRGVTPDQLEAALATLEPELERARRLAATSAPAKAGRTLAARGFAPETIESVLGVSDD
jgi:regulatory protein